MREDGRTPSELRKVKITCGYNSYAEGSCLMELGRTKVSCTASVETHIPRWLQGQDRGWVQAEYAMLPRSTHTRMKREKTHSSGRSLEISRLIGRSLRSCVDLRHIRDLQISVDCDVLQADGGTRTAAITGGFVALFQALCYLKKKKQIKSPPVKHFLSATSVGLYQGEVLLDLSYQEDSQADADCNFVINNQGEVVEIQGTSEQKPIERKSLEQMLDQATEACLFLQKEQKNALCEALSKNEIHELMQES